MSVPANTSIAPPNTLSRVVVDASVAIKWFVPEVHAEAACRLLQEGMTLLAPDLIWAEVANALWRKWREKELSAETVQEILTDFRRFPLHIQSGESLYDVAWRVAQGSGRTFYDSLFLALAMSTGCPLVTADLRFFNALRDTPWGRHCLWVENL
ncbi:MAG TPA: type II toxin-antitoxin system VapC family toxin [Anaerolineae bacterium]|nr:type II toxin-antitoxin system VapC family toxin [Anaerolineae bacterium]